MKFEVFSINASTNGWTVAAAVFEGIGNDKKQTGKILHIQGLSRQEAMEYEIGDEIAL